MNNYLKEIADLCGISKNLNFNLAHHTFATTVTLSNGVPIETASKIIGHTSIKTTPIFGRILDARILSEMLNLKSKLALKIQLI
jgi:site-specific recombinase XerD